MRGRLAALLLGLALLLAPAVAPAANTSSISVTTDSSGDATVFSQVINGRVIYISYEDGFDDTADFTITVESTGEGLWTQTNRTAAQVVAPTKLVQDQVGVDTTQRDYVWAIATRIKIVVAQGGATKTAVFEVAWF